MFASSSVTVIKFQVQSDIQDIETPRPSVVSVFSKTFQVQSDNQDKETFRALECS